MVVEAIKKIVLPVIAAGSIVVAGSVHNVTERQYDFTSQWEGVSYVPYADIASPSILTVCRGITSALAPGWVIKGKKYSQEECFNKEVELMEKVSKQIAPLIKVDMTQSQREMIGDFVWNVGITQFKSSTLLKKINKGDCLGASLEFDNWTKSGGRVWRGLANRRNAEEDIFNNYCLPDGTFMKQGVKYGS